MIVGVDFDNTIVCYDDVIYQSALREGLIPPSLIATKGIVRDYLRSCGKEDEWTALQGYVYGIGIKGAAPFPGVKEFFARCRRKGITVSIISHKTLSPFRGPEYNLHHAAHEWLALHGFYDPTQVGLTPEQVHFELTKQGKLERIATTNCTHFIDDLPEFLAEPEFPSGVQRILFTSSQPDQTTSSFWRAASWNEIASLLVC